MSEKKDYSNEGTKMVVINYGREYCIKTPNADLTIDQLHNMCTIMATTLGYADKSIEKTFGESGGAFYEN